MKTFKKLTSSQFRDLINNGTGEDYDKYKSELAKHCKDIENRNHKARYKAMVTLDQVSNTVPQFVEAFKHIELKVDNSYTKKTKPVMDALLEKLAAEFPSVRIWIDKSVYSIYVEFSVNYTQESTVRDELSNGRVSNKLYICQLDTLEREENVEICHWDIGTLAQYKSKIKKVAQLENDINEMTSLLSGLKYELNL